MSDKVVIRKLNSKDEMVKVGEFRLKDGKVICTIPKLLDKMRGQMPRNYVGGNPDYRVPPSKAKLFMKNLPYHFKSPYFMAMEE